MKVSLRGKSKDPRLAARTHRPSLTALYWTGGVCRPLDLRDVSATGAYINTDIDWCAGSVVHLVLLGDQSSESQDESPKPTFGMWARIVRASSNGMGVEFLFRDPKEARQFQRFLETAAAIPETGQGRTG